MDSFLKNSFNETAIKNWLATEGKEWLWSILVAVVLVFGVIRPFIIQAYKIPSGSMRMTLVEGDKIFVNKFIYRFHPPQRGDIVVFRYPGDPNNPNESKDELKKDFIKRLVAFEDEIVEIKDGKIIVNGKILDDPLTFGKFYYFNQGTFGHPYQQIKVPKASYFVLGDNSGSSRDSRFWGFVPKKNMIGKALFRWWPLNRVGMLK